MLALAFAFACWASGRRSATVLAPEPDPDVARPAPSAAPTVLRTPAPSAAPTVLRPPAASAPGQALPTSLEGEGVFEAGIERAVVRGRVERGAGGSVAGARVVAFGVETTTDAEGRYRLEVTGSSPLVVQADVDVVGSEVCKPFASGQTEPIELDGRGAYEADVLIEQDCGCEP